MATHSSNVMSTPATISLPFTFIFSLPISSSFLSDLLYFPFIIRFSSSHLRFPQSQSILRSFPSSPPSSFPPLKPYTQPFLLRISHFPLPSPVHHHHHHALLKPFPHSPLPIACLPPHILPSLLFLPSPSVKKAEENGVKESDGGHRF